MGVENIPVSQQTLPPDVQQGNREGFPVVLQTDGIAPEASVDLSSSAVIITHHDLSGLTTEEKKIYSCLQAGLSGKKIAECLGISPKNLHNKKAAVCEKLNTTDSEILFTQPTESARLHAPIVEESVMSALSDDERNLLQRIGQVQHDREIAKQLGVVTISKVERRIQYLVKTLGLRSRQEAILFSLAYMQPDNEGASTAQNVPRVFPMHEQDGSGLADAQKVLTKREREVFDLLLQGKHLKEIARQLPISARTVQTHLRNIYTKMGASSGYALIARHSHGGAASTMPVVETGRWDSLTDTERRIVHYVAQGLSNAQIAQEMERSVTTISLHVHHIYSKLDLDGRKELIRAFNPAGNRDKS